MWHLMKGFALNHYKSLGIFIIWAKHQAKKKKKYNLKAVESKVYAVCPGAVFLYWTEMNFSMLMIKLWIEITNKQDETFQFYFMCFKDLWICLHNKIALS